MTLKDLTLVMTPNTKIVVEHKAKDIFIGTVENFYNNTNNIGEEVETSHFLEKVVSQVFYNVLYHGIWIVIED